MSTRFRLRFGLFGLLIASSFGLWTCSEGPGTVPFDNYHEDGEPPSGDEEGDRAPDPAVQHATLLIQQGRDVFRHDTFGSEAFWGDALQLHEALKTVAPSTALAVGLKVDARALPDDVIAAITSGSVDLDDPAVTLSLLQLDAVVGVRGFFTGGDLTSVGITCALCHSVVDDDIAPGIGNRLDGWANRDLDVGTIISLAPNRAVIADRLDVTLETLDQVLASWGPGKFDALVLQDGRAFRPDGGAAATLIPPAFGLAGANLHTSTGFGSVPYWNAYVATTEMRGQGTFFDPRLNDPEMYPIAVETGDWNIRSDPDLVSSKLPALHMYQLALAAPPPPPDLFDEAAAIRGKALFEGRADCARCHVPPLYMEPGWSMHTPEEIGIDDFQASRSPTGRYRTAPLAGLWTHRKGGFYHDGRFATLRDVIEHYDDHFDLRLSDGEKEDLVQYLLSIGRDLEEGEGKAAP